MRCGRCAGLSVPETMLDGGMRAIAYRCVHCGDLTDGKILLHRSHRPTASAKRPRTPIFGSDRWKRPRPTLA